MRFHLSEEPAGSSYRTVQNGLFDVTGGSIEKASRLNPGQNNGWILRIDPSGVGDAAQTARAQHRDCETKSNSGQNVGWLDSVSDDSMSLTASEITRPTRSSLDTC